MQSWKIKRMSVKLLERWLDSVDKLLLHYLGEKKLKDITCPLCWSDCSDCLWEIIEEMSCVNFMMILYSHAEANTVVDLRGNLKFKKWKLARIKQLTNWRGVIASELAGRYVERRKNEKRKRSKKET